MTINIGLINWVLKDSIIFNIFKNLFVPIWYRKNQIDIQILSIIFYFLVLTKLIL